MTRVDTSGTAANASLISTRSMSSIVMPTWLSTSLADSAGIDAIRSGCPDAIAQPMSMARGSVPRRSASSGDISTIADAPVLRPGALPAVTVALP